MEPASNGGTPDMRPESSAGSEMGAGSPDNNYQGRDGSIDRDLESGGSSSRAQPSKKQKLDKEGNDQQPQKKKRKQLVACDSCRLRRVKCDRSEKPPGEDCSECLKKAIKCTDNYVRQKPKVVRSGKLITQAKVLFGPNDGHAQPEIPQERPRRTDDIYPLGVVDQLNVTATNDSRLAKIAVEREVSEHLIKLYEHVVHAQLPVIDYEGFIQAWRAVDCDTMALPPAYECLSAVIQAWACRFSDHPAIVGHAAPILPDVTKSFGRDYTEYGNKRAAFCRAMSERALRVADNTGSFRHPSNATAGALLMLELLLCFDSHDRKPARHLLNSAIEHLRQIHEGLSEVAGETPNELERSSGSSMFWFAYTRDAVSSLFARRSTVLSSDDLAVLCEIIRAPITADPAAFVNSTDPQLLQGLAVVSSFRHLTSIVRSCCANVTNPVARKYGSVNSASLLSIWSDAEKSAVFSHQLVQSIRRADWSKDGIPQSHVWFRDMTGVRAQLLYGVHAFLTETLAQAEAAARDNDVAAPHADLPNLRHLKQSSDRHFLVACRDLTHMLHGYRGAVLLEAYMVTEFIGDCLRHMIDMPAGRSPDFLWTLDEKANDIIMMTNVVRMIGWNSPNLRPAVEAGEQCLASIAAQAGSNGNVASYSQLSHAHSQLPGPPHQPSNMPSLYNRSGNSPGMPSNNFSAGRH